MVADVIILFENSFSKCVEWTTALFDAVGGGGFVIAAFIIYLVVSLFLVPLRGSYLSDNGAFNEFRFQVTHKKPNKIGFAPSGSSSKKSSKAGKAGVRY